MFNEMIYDLSRLKYQEYNAQFNAPQTIPPARRISLVQWLQNALHSIRTAQPVARPARVHAVSGK